MAYIGDSSLESQNRVAFEFVDGDVKKIRIVNVRELHEAWVSSRDGRPIALKPFKTGYPIENTHIPTRIRIKSTMEHYPCCWFYEDFKWIVCAEFKQLVEELEPDTHQFFPITVLSPKDEVVDERFLFVICQRLDTISYGESTGLSETKDKEKGNLCAYTRNYLAKVVFRKNAIEGHHIWWDKYLDDGFIMSDRFAKELKIRKLHGIRALEMDEQ